MYLLDSDIVIWALRKNPTALALLEELIETDETGISTATVAEIYKNIFPKELEITEEFLEKQEIVSVSLEIGKTGGLYWRDYQKRTPGLNIIDCLIAATAKIQNTTLVTLNTKHFLMDDIKVISPTKLSSKR